MSLSKRDHQDCSKVGEEAVELVIEAKDSNDELFKMKLDLVSPIDFIGVVDQSFSSIERALKSRSMSKN